MSLDPADVQARVRLAALLFRAAMPRFAQALAAAGQPPPRAPEKELLLAELERAAWAAPADALAGADDDAWETRVLQAPAIRKALADAVEARVRARIL